MGYSLISALTVISVCEILKVIILAVGVIELLKKMYMDDLKTK